MATNGYTAKLWPALQGVIVPLRGHATAHRPGSGLPKEGLPRTYSFIYEDGYEYMVSRRPGSTGEGDIIIGGGLTIGAEQGLYEYGTTDDTAADPIIIDYLKETTTRYFGRNWGNDDPTGRIKQEWTGIMGYSADGFPFVGQVPGENGLYIAASFQGSGMVLCFDTARTLALLMNDEAESAKKMLPECFWITEERLKHTFTGRLHTKVPKDLKLKEQPDD
ncbi:hypothetical protein MMC25_001805 [Agyrium rufum]|nr:hypothetical protein [Agyrium rufum]